MNDLWAEACSRPQHYEQHENRCQKSASALILMALLPARGYELDSLSRLRCINSSHWYNLFLI